MDDRKLGDNASLSHVDGRDHQPSASRMLLLVEWGASPHSEGRVCAQLLQVADLEARVNVRTGASPTGWVAQIAARGIPHSADGARSYTLEAPGACARVASAEPAIRRADAYVFGLLGFAMLRWGIPVGPAVIGLILGPLAETQFRRALSISQGDASVFFTQPISATFLAITAALVIVPWVVRRARRRG